MAAEPRAVWQGPGLKVGTRNPSEGRAGGREQRKPAKNWPSEQAPLQDPGMGWVWGRDCESGWNGEVEVREYHARAGLGEEHGGGPGRFEGPLRTRTKSSRQVVVRSGAQRPGLGWRWQDVSRAWVDSSHVQDQDTQGRVEGENSCSLQAVDGKMEARTRELTRSSLSTRKS